VKSYTGEERNSEVLYRGGNGQVRSYTGEVMYSEVLYRVGKEQ
jgi:hypothetical protein